MQNAPRRRLAVASVASPNGVLQRFNHTTKRSFAVSSSFGFKSFRVRRMLCNTRVCAVTCVNGERRCSTSRATKAFPPTPPLVGLFGGRRTAAGRVQNAPRRRLAVASVASPNGVLQRFNHTTKRSFAVSSSFGFKSFRVRRMFVWHVRPHSLI